MSAVRRHGRVPGKFSGIHEELTRLHAELTPGSSGSYTAINTPARKGLLARLSQGIEA